MRIYPCGSMVASRIRSVGWARLHCESGVLLFVRAEHAADPRAEGILLCMYTPDLIALRSELQTNGVAVPPIG
jgi:hypothetical protein